VSYSPARNEKGTSYQRVMLSAASWAARSGAPVQVLSEGERRAIALAAFLAELGTRKR
jgi:wobble nucleotide-excising tRNase